ncbi:MAG: tetratricopeptide repeat protein [Deltaproteobacteria bacterium]|nr:tetratricopeptide repeat protein [Deltaproteobacteria bacterium]
MLETEDLQILAELAFGAVFTGNMLPARTIFEGLAAARPEHEAPRIGMAMSHYMVNEFDRAEEILRGLIQDKPGFRPAVVNLALCLILSGKKTEARPLLLELEKNNDPQYSDMVGELLGLCP